jgi:hypothetical protein
MPLTPKGEEIKSNMEKEYGTKKGTSVFYASANKGTIKGVHTDRRDNMNEEEAKDVTEPKPTSGPMATGGPNGTSESLPKTVEPFSEVKDARKPSDCMSLDEIKANAKRIGRY